MERKDRGEEWIITAAGGSGEQDERERWESDVEPALTGRFCSVWTDVWGDVRIILQYVSNELFNSPKYNK